MGRQQKKDKWRLHPRLVWGRFRLEPRLSLRHFKRAASGPVQGLKLLEAKPSLLAEFDLFDYLIFLGQY